MNLLFYVEPHPIRNSYTEWFHIANLLTPVFLKYAAQGDINVRVFSNNWIIEKLLDSIPNSNTHIQRPTLTETNFIEQQFTYWNEASISTWLDLVAGQGEVAEFYLSIIDRMHAILPIDIIFTWSENGALRRFSELTGVPVIYGELGPTRAPFIETMYFDINGTNGNASFRKRARNLIEGREPSMIPSAQSWLIWSDKKITDSQNIPSLIDLPSTFNKNLQNILPPNKYVYIPLQLADDLNTLMHSEYKTPKEFLIYVLPQISQAGYAAVIKGHPGAEDRAYNLRHEIEALQYAEESGFDVTIIPRKAGQNLSAYVLGSASYTLSINSSVCFESMLLGVPAIVAGAASFDADGWLQENISLCPVSQYANFSKEMDTITATYMQSVFVPKEIVLNTDYLLRLFMDVIADSGSVFNRSNSTSQIDFTDTILIGAPLNFGLAALPYIGFQSVVQGDKVMIHSDRLSIHRMKKNSSVLTLRVSSIFLGYIDICSQQENSLVIGGWAIDKKTCRPPMQIIMLKGETIISTHRINHKREDVVQFVNNNVTTSFCGFKFELKNANLENLSLVLVGYDGECQLIGDIESNLSIHEVVQ